MNTRTVQVLVTVSYKPADYELAYGTNDDAAPEDVRNLVLEGVQNRWRPMDWGEVKDATLVGTTTEAVEDPHAEGIVKSGTYVIVPRTDKKIRATRIKLHRVEGRPDECVAVLCLDESPEGLDCWEQAAIQLTRWSVTAPGDGSVDKTDFVVTYADGVTYSGMFGLKCDDTDLPAHIRRHLQFVLDHPREHERYVSIDETRNFLNRYEIGRQ